MPILISHRGNLDGPQEWCENSPAYVERAVHNGFFVEIDVWFVSGQWFLGHDEPKYKVSEDFLFLNPRFWVHCKNADAAVEFATIKMNGGHVPVYFWHQTDDYAITSNGLLWTYPGKPLTNLSICVLPEQTKDAYTKKQLKNCLAICSDYIEDYTEL